MEPRRGSIRTRESDLLQKGKADSQGRWIASGDSTRPCESALAAARVAITAQIDLDGGDAVAAAALGLVERLVGAPDQRFRRLGRIARRRHADGDGDRQLVGSARDGEALIRHPRTAESRGGEEGVRK